MIACCVVYRHLENSSGCFQVHSLQKKLYKVKGFSGFLVIPKKTRNRRFLGQLVRFRLTHGRFLPSIRFVSDQSSKYTTKEELQQALSAAIADTKVQLPTELVKRWLQEIGWTYGNFSDAIGCAESTVKNWLCTKKQIPSSRKGKVRGVLKHTLACQESGELNLSGAVDGKWTYNMAADLYGILERIAKIQKVQVSDIIDDALLSWAGMEITRGALTLKLTHWRGLDKAMQEASLAERELEAALKDAKTSLSQVEKDRKKVEKVGERLDYGEHRTQLIKKMESMHKQQSEFIDELKEALEAARSFKKICKRVYDKENGATCTPGRRKSIRHRLVEKLAPVRNV